MNELNSVFWSKYRLWFWRSWLIAVNFSFQFVTLNFVFSIDYIDNFLFNLLHWFFSFQLVALIFFLFNWLHWNCSFQFHALKPQCLIYLKFLSVISVLFVSQWLIVWKVYDLNKECLIVWKRQWKKKQPTVWEYALRVLHNCLKKTKRKRS
jgi:hypothetical protein